MTGCRRERLLAARRGVHPLAKSAQKIQFSASRDIPFNKLVLSQANVRQIKTVKFVCTDCSLLLLPR
ncbi:hypothetical protein FEV16_11245 [Methylocystis sp. B8]|nr:hypothetical protein FEV16_11245 [Methylocystis sp. B8]